MCKIITLFLFSSIAHAVDTPIAGNYRQFDGGLNTCDASISIPVNESPNLMNVVIDEPLGTLSQRLGYATCGNTPSGNPATNLFEYNKNDGSRNLIVTDNVSIWQTPDCVQFSTITTGLSALGFPRFAIVQDKLWAVNGSTWPIVWDGTTATQLDGQGGRPTGPRGKLITYWKSRVWIGNTPTQSNGLYFSSLVDSAGNILDPATSTMAWANTLNVVLFGGSGGPLYGIKVYRDNMYAFLENDIFRMLFESEYTVNGISVNKAVAKTGSKFQDSIVEMDDSLLRFVGRDGVYLFDGSTIKRISKKWTPTFFSFKQPSHSEQFKLWDTVTDWTKGSLDINVSTSLYPGSISLGYEDFADRNYTTNPVWTIASGVVTSTNGYLESVAPSSLVFSSTTQNTGDFKFKYFNGPNTTNTSYFLFSEDKQLPYTPNNAYYLSVNSGSGAAWKSTIELAAYQGGIYSVICSSNGAAHQIPSNSLMNITMTRTGQNFYVDIGSLTCSGTNVVNLTSGAFFGAYLTSGSRIDDLQFIKKSTGVYTSQVSTATDLTTWKTFDTDETLNSQSISYQIRTAATASAVLTTPWRAISAGVLVSSTTNNYVQWMATFTTTDNGLTPVLNSAVIGWVTGDTTITPITALNYKSRYWLSASTTAGNNYNDIVMVQNRTGGSSQEGFTRFNLPLSAMVLWNNLPYAAIGNTSKIVRFDYGDTDDGAGITSWWDSRDEIYDNPVMYKSINQLISDYSSLPANNAVKIGLSLDFGGNWQYQTINTGKTPALARNTSIVNVNANRALQFRSRVYNDKLGVNFLLYGLYNFGIMSDFHGN